MSTLRCASLLCRQSWRWLALLGILGMVNQSRAELHYTIHSWQTENGLPQNFVTTVLQASNGYIWAGTYNGLVRFDGERFKVFNNANTPGLSSSRITSLLEGADGTLWIGHEGGELTRFSSNRFEAAPVPSNWNGQRIAYLAQDGAKDLWLASSDGVLFRFRDGFIYTAAAGPGSGAVRARAFSFQGNLWVGRNGVMSSFENGRWATLGFDGLLAGNYVQAACPSQRGGLWVVRNGLIRKWDNNKWVDDRGVAPWGQRGGVNGFLESKSGLLVAGSADSGLFLISSNGEVQHYSRTNGLGSDWVSSVCEDREGNLWVGTHAGLVMLRETCLATATPPDQWQGHAILSVICAHDGSIWTGTEGGGLYRLDRGSWTNFGSADGLPSPFVWSVTEDPSGRIWGGTWDHGAFVQTGTGFQPAPHIDFEGTVRAFLHVAPDNFYLGTTQGLLHLQGENKTWIRPGSKSGLPDVRTIVRGGDGRIWFGMFGRGLACLKNGELSQFGKAQGLSSDYVQCLKTEADGTLWIGTFGGGLTRLKQGKFMTIGEKQGLPNNVICDIEEDNRGFFWMSSSAGIMRAARAELEQCADGLRPTAAFRVYNTSDGMPSAECSGGLQPAGCQTPDGRIWFPTVKGLVIVNPNDVKTNNMAPPVIMEEVVIDGRLVFGGGNEPSPPQIPPGSHRIQFRYTAMSFAAPEKVEFKYRVIGLDKDWVKAGGNRVADYTYIPPGKHTFEVIACNNDGVWNQAGARIDFVALPYFWQTMGFRIVAGAFILGSVGAVAWLESRRRMRRRLERLERQRTLEKERTRIANDIHDDLGAQLTRIGMYCDPSQNTSDRSESESSKLQHVYDATHELKRSMDEIVWAVNPCHDTFESLVNYLHKFAQDFLEVAGIRCRFNIPIDLPAWPLFAETRHNLFLAFKEALNNAAKHSKATEVRISLSVTSVGFSLTIEDNGRGFVPGRPGGAAAQNTSRGHGLKSIAHRLKEMGGDCQIISAPGQGARIVFFVPAQVGSARVGDR